MNEMCYKIVCHIFHGSERHRSSKWSYTLIKGIFIAVAAAMAHTPVQEHCTFSTYKWVLLYVALLFMTSIIAIYGVVSESVIRCWGPSHFGYGAPWILVRITTILKWCQKAGSGEWLLCKALFILLSVTVQSFHQQSRQIGQEEVTETIMEPNSQWGVGSNSNKNHKAVVNRT